MIYKALTITLIAGSCSTGCSIIGERFSELYIPNQNINVEMTKVMLYNFIPPRRKPAPQTSNKKFSTSEHHTYFSANGHKCKVITSNGPQPVCFINGSWQETAPIFSSKAP